MRVERLVLIADSGAIWLGGNHELDWVSAYPLADFEDWPSAQAIRGHPVTRGEGGVGAGV